MTAIKYSTQFKKDYKSLTVSDQKSVDNAILILAKNGTLPYSPYLTHKLISNYKNHLEAHIKPNLLIIWYEIEGDTIKLVRVGSHAKLFGK